MRAAANFLVANYGRQKIITMPRSVPKIATFEEAARTLEIPGGVRMIQEYYRQMRKFGCNILAVVQQYDVLRNSEARGAIIGNSKMFLITSQQSREDAKEIGEALSLSEKTVDTINSYPLPELMDPRGPFSQNTQVTYNKQLAHIQKDRLLPTKNTLSERVRERLLLFASVRSVIFPFSGVNESRNYPPSFTVLGVVGYVRGAFGY